MDGFPGVLLRQLPVNIAAVLLAFYCGVKLVLLVQDWRRERKGEPAAAAPVLDIKPITQHLDLTLTGMFDQLRRDLQRTIERAHETGQKEAANTMQRFLLELELFVKDPSDERRRRPRP